MSQPPITFRRERSDRPPAAGYEKKLSIVVPYRDRAEHLKQFVPHLLAYFERDKLDRCIEYSIHIVEQHGTGRFNRGKLKNCGFSLTRKYADYVCFHDIDYLPIWADYSYCEPPTRLIWHGLIWGENHDKFFGGVVLFTPAAFERINGYSNEYWGWGFEDTELLLRMKIAGLDFAKRDGTFLALPHADHRYQADGKPSAEGTENQRLFLQRRENIGALYPDDGLSSLSYEVISSANISLNNATLPHVYHHVVKI